jgi:hypothetical protein
MPNNSTTLSVVFEGKDQVSQTIRQIKDELKTLQDTGSSGKEILNPAQIAEAEEELKLVNEQIQMVKENLANADFSKMEAAFNAMTEQGSQVRAVEEQMVAGVNEYIDATSRLGTNNGIQAAIEEWQLLEVEEKLATDYYQNFVAMANSALSPTGLVETTEQIERLSGVMPEVADEVKILSESFMTLGTSNGIMEATEQVLQLAESEKVAADSAKIMGTNVESAGGNIKTMELGIGSMVQMIPQLAVMGAVFNFADDISSATIEMNRFRAVMDVMPNSAMKTADAVNIVREASSKYGVTFGNISQPMQTMFGQLKYLNSGVQITAEQMTKGAEATGKFGMLLATLGRQGAMATRDVQDLFESFGQGKPTAGLTRVLQGLGLGFESFKDKIKEAAEAGDYDAFMSNITELVDAMIPFDQLMKEDPGLAWNIFMQTLTNTVATAAQSILPALMSIVKALNAFLSTPFGGAFLTTFVDAMLVLGAAWISLSVWKGVGTVFKPLQIGLMTLSESLSGIAPRIAKAADGIAGALGKITGLGGKGAKTGGAAETISPGAAPKLDLKGFSSWSETSKLLGTMARGMVVAMAGITMAMATIAVALGEFALLGMEFKALEPQIKAGVEGIKIGLLGILMITPLIAIITGLGAIGLEAAVPMLLGAAVAITGISAAMAVLAVAIGEFALLGGAMGGHETEIQSTISIISQMMLALGQLVAISFEGAVLGIMQLVTFGGALQVFGFATALANIKLMIAAINSISMGTVDASKLDSVFSSIGVISDVINKYAGINFSSLPGNTWWSQIGEAFSGSLVDNFKLAMGGHEGAGGIIGMIAAINEVPASAVDTSSLTSVMSSIQTISDVIGSYASIDFSKLPGDDWWDDLKRCFSGDLVNNFKLAIGGDGTGIYGMIQAVNATTMVSADTGNLSGVLGAIQSVVEVMSSYNSIDFSKLPGDDWWDALKRAFTGNISDNFKLALGGDGTGITGMIQTINAFDIAPPTDTVSAAITQTAAVINNINAALAAMPGAIQEYYPLLLTGQLNNAFDGARQVIAALDNSGITTAADPSGYILQTVATLRNINNALSQFFNVDYSKVEPARLALVAAKKAVKSLQDELNGNAVSSFLNWITGGLLGSGAVNQANVAVQGLKDYQKKIDETVKKAEDETAKLLGKKDDLQKQVDAKNKKPEKSPGPVVIPGIDIVGGGINDNTKDALKTLNSVLTGDDNSNNFTMINGTVKVQHTVDLNFNPSPIKADYNFTADSNVQGSDINPDELSKLVSDQLSKEVNDQILSSITSRQVVQTLSRQLNQTR